MCTADRAPSSSRPKTEHTAGSRHPSPRRPVLIFLSRLPLCCAGRPSAVPCRSAPSTRPCLMKAILMRSVAQPAWREWRNVLGPVCRKGAPCPAAQLLSRKKNGLIAQVCGWHSRKKGCPNDPHRGLPGQCAHFPLARAAFTLPRGPASLASQAEDKLLITRPPCHGDSYCGTVSPAGIGQGRARRGAPLRCSRPGPARAAASSCQARVMQLDGVAGAPEEDPVPCAPNLDGHSTRAAGLRGC